jgi:hypothetical protein
MADYVVNRKMGNDNVITAERHDTDVDGPIAIANEDDSFLGSYSATIALKMDAVCTSETCLFQRDCMAATLHISQSCHLHSRCHENQKSKELTTELHLLQHQLCNNLLQ